MKILILGAGQVGGTLAENLASENFDITLVDTNGDRLRELRDRLDIQTIEGMASGEELHPLQKKFVDEAALQCGICTPGVLVAAKALLERNPDPTETEVRYWLAGNLCRCTGYDKIIRAVMDTAAEMRAN